MIVFNVFRNCLMLICSTKFKGIRNFNISESLNNLFCVFKVTLVLK